MSLYNHQSLFLQQPSILALFHLYSTLSAKRIDSVRLSVCLLLLTPPTNPTQPPFFPFAPRFQLPSQKGAVGRCVPTYTVLRGETSMARTRPNRTFDKDFCTASRMLIGTHLTWLPNYGKLLVTLLDISSVHWLRIMKLPNKWQGSLGGGSGHKNTTKDKFLDELRSELSI
jgi:hypothetical protein